jgi:ribonuclease BN (tRNA processing enzyme)
MVAAPPRQLRLHFATRKPDMRFHLNRRSLLTGLGTAAGTSLLLAKIKQALAQQNPGQPAKSRTRVILLGTGAGPRPQVRRAAAANAVIIDGVLYVVDCGNGVARQLVRADVALRTLRCIFLTHHHSDHTADYGNLLQLAWASGLGGRVDAYGPPPLQRMTELFFDMVRPEMETRIKEGRKPFENDIHTHDISKAGLVYEDERTKVTSTIVHHPEVEPALAFRFDTADRSVVFSGDTGPSEDLVHLAQGADVLIHEVTYMPLIEKEFRKNPARDVERAMQHTRESHTSLEDVGKIATAAKVKTLVLSHIAPDDPELTDQILLDGAAKNFSGKVIVGRDLLEI